MTATRPQAGTVGAFLLERYLPVYPIYLALWVCAVESMVAVLAGTGGWWPTWDTVLTILALLAAGAFLRMVDDQKDLSYDAVHNPHRPLVTGRITVRQLRRAMLWCAAVASGCAALVSAAAAAVLVLTLGYGLLLWWLEIKWSRVGQDPLLSLAVACPAQFLVTGFIMLGQPGVDDVPWWRLLAVPVVFTGAFLYLEFARKTSRTIDDDPHSYSNVLGAMPSALVAAGFGVAAVTLTVLLTADWPALLIVWLPLVSSWKFLTGGAIRYPHGLAAAFVPALHLTVIVQGLVHH